MNFHNQIPPQVHIFQSETIYSHRFYSDDNSLLKVEFVKINGRFYYGVHEYRIDPNSQTLKPVLGVFLDCSIWHNFLKLAINLTNLTTPFYNYQCMS